MHRSLPLLLPVVLLGCGVDPITAEGLDGSWKEAIAWPEADPNIDPSAIITDPGAISGEYTSTLYGGECVVTWQMTGTRTDCRDCDFAFEVEMEVVEDDCGAGYATRATFMLNSGWVYLNYTRLAEYTMSGNTLTWDSRTSEGDDEPYGYYYYDYDYYSNDYYGSATFLAR